VHDGTRLGLDLLDRHAPLVGGRLLEHLAAGGAGLAPRGEMVTDAAAAAVGLRARHRVAVDLRVGGRLLDLHLREIDVELVGNDHRHRRARALAHLRHGVDDGHLTVAVDAEPLVGRELAGLGRLLGVGAERQAEADDEPGAERGRALQELATGKLEAVHDLPPFAAR